MKRILWSFSICILGGLVAFPFIAKEVRKRREDEQAHLALLREQARLESERTRLDELEILKALRRSYPKYKSYWDGEIAEWEREEPHFTIALSSRRPFRNQPGCSAFACSAIETGTRPHRRIM